MDRDDPAVGWLLSSSDPSVRYLTMVDLLDVPPRGRAVQRERERIPRGHRVRALLRGQRRDGGFGVHAYTKWTGSFWRLISLVELAIPARHPRAHAAAEEVLGWLGSDRHRRTIRLVNGLVRQHAAQEGFALVACCRLGKARDPRVRLLVDSLLESQWPDGGWNCDVSPEARHSSFHETFAPLMGLAGYARATGDHAAQEGVDRATELLLDHRLFRSHRSGRVADDSWLKLRYPTYWHYDILRGLLAAAAVGMTPDPRATRAAEVIDAKRRKDGSWAPEGYYWKPPGGSGSNVEAVDWGRRGPNEMLTLDALRALRAAGRL